MDTTSTAHPRGWSLVTVQRTKDTLLNRRHIDANGCWIWTGASVKGPYGVITALGEHWLVHRLAYELWNGVIAKGLVIDHVNPACKSTLCFNPDHLEAMAPIVNFARSECKGAVNLRTGRCKRGHPWIPANIHVFPSGLRRCQACLDLMKQERRIKRDSSRCKRGHLWTPENIYEYKGVRRCRGCLAIAEQKRRQKRQHGSSMDN